MPFLKLDCGILDSSLWVNPVVRDIFITALLMCEPYEVRESEPQLDVYLMVEKEFKVPPGWYGLARAAGVGIIRRALIEDIQAGMEALRVLGEPEEHSRSKEYEGRRLVRINGGYLALNFDKYRFRDYTNAERQARFRERKRKSNAVTPLSNTVISRCVTQAEAKAEAKETKTRERARAIALPPDFLLTPERRAYAESKGVKGIEREFESFRAYHTAHGKTMKSWEAAWKTWCLQYPKFAGREAKRASVMDGAL